MECESECKSECANVSIVSIGDIDIIDNIGNIDSFGNIGRIDNIGESETHCQRERSIHLSYSHSGTLLPIREYETFDYSPLRGNSAL